MPTPNVHPSTIADKKTRGQKHRTKAEIESLKSAADELKRHGPSNLKPPEWLSPKARTIFNRKITEIRGLNSPDTLLDELDTDLLAVYCDHLVNYQELAKKNGLTTIDKHKLKQTYTLRIIGAAERLGFTPASRARLIRKHAMGQDDDPFKNKFD